VRIGAERIKQTKRSEWEEERREEKIARKIFLGVSSHFFPFSVSPPQKKSNPNAYTSRLLNLNWRVWID